MSKDYKVVPFEGDRFCVIDAETGEILDDAQGYGYRTRQKAHAGWSYKSKSDSEKKAMRDMQTAVESWLKNHKGVEDEVEILCWDAAHDGYSDKELREAVMDVLTPYSSELPCDIRTFVRIMFK